MHSEEFKDLALSFPGIISQSHFDRIVFKVEGKRIFATLLEKSLELQNDSLNRMRKGVSYRQFGTGWIEKTWKFG